MPLMLELFWIRCFVNKWTHRTFPAKKPTLIIHRKCVTLPPILQTDERMINADDLLEGQSQTLAIEKEVVYLDSLKEVERVQTDPPVKMEYNAIIHCRKGRVLLEMGGKEQIRVSAGQLLLVPARKLLQPMMMSTDVDAAVLLISDHVLKQVLGPQIDIWNRAMYLQEIYVIDGQRWTDALKSQSRGVYRGEELRLFNDLVLAFLRFLLLIICEELLHVERPHQPDDAFTDRDKILFHQFLDLLSHEQQKRRQVGYYAEKLNVTPKYLSTVCSKVSGKSPVRWITDSVMEDCYQLLRTTDLTVKEISNRLGFPNSSFFGQYFREQAGMTPIKYRTKHTV